MGRFWLLVFSMFFAAVSGLAQTVPKEANWICGLQRPDSWRSGGPAVGNGKIASYDVV